MKPGVAGFTLIECWWYIVVIALLRVAKPYTDHTNALCQSDVLLAHLCAENEPENAPVAPDAQRGRQHHQLREQAGRLLVVTFVGAPTPNPEFVRTMPSRSMALWPVLRLLSTVVTVLRCPHKLVASFAKVAHRLHIDRRWSPFPSWL
jgi:general secretion pathway protein I